MGKKVNLDEIDEQFIIDSFKYEPKPREISEDDEIIEITPKAQKYVPSAVARHQERIKIETKKDNGKENKREPMKDVESVQQEEIQSAKLEEENDVERKDADKPEPRRKKSRLAEYEMLFLHESEITAREGKSINLRVEFHNDLLSILRFATQGKVSLFSYLDNIVKHHFDTYENEIRELEEKEGGLLKWKK